MDSSLPCLKLHIQDSIGKPFEAVMQKPIRPFGVLWFSELDKCFHKHFSTGSACINTGLPTLILPRLIEIFPGSCKDGIELRQD